MKNKIALVIAVIALLGVVGWSSKAESASRDNWEYKLVTKHQYHDASPLSLNEFNDLGSEGWELVTVLTAEVVHVNQRHLKVSYYFKRRA